MTKKFPKSIRVFIRRQKAKIRKQFIESVKANEAIELLYKKIK